MPDTTLDVPQSVKELIELPPTEDMVIDVLRKGLPDVPIFSLIPNDPPMPMIFVRKLPGLGLGNATDERFFITTRFEVQVLAKDPDGDEKGAVISEAVRVVLRDAWMRNHHVPGLGWVKRIRLMSEASRGADWATSAGPIQYAELPIGVWRYESKFSIKVKRELPK